MPAIKSSSSSKRGAPKQKGAIRAKSGCYTCRIRRKGGFIKTPCPIFPDIHAPHKESRNVTELREKIKSFLAAQGMIKGHSGTGPRDAEPEHPTLHLRTEDYSSASESPPIPTLSLADPSRPHHMISSIRDDHYGLGEFSSPSNLYPADFRDTSPFSSRGSSSDPSPYQLSHVVDTTLSVTFPPLASSFSDLYFWQVPEEIMDIGLPPAAHLPRNPGNFLQPNFLDDMLNHYRDRVVKAQYLFADSEIRNLICEVVWSHPPSSKGASLLSSVHWQRFSNPNALAFNSQETRHRLSELETLLSHPDLSSGDAMAALHVVSSYLFDGGCGDWERWLNLSCTYVDNIFSKYASPLEALVRCSTKDVFIIKTSIWFDVLASMTTQKVPHFLHAIRIMFDPTRSKIQELGAEDPSSMMSPMGCHNEVVWALSEASDLYCWKRRQQAKDSLSIPVLVRRAAEIEEWLQPPSPPMAYPSTDIDGCRVVASEIFRASARLYLRAVVSGDHPNVPEIKESVQDTIDCMQRLNYPPCDAEVNGQTMSRSVVRNTVFSFFICGAFAERQEHREVIQNLLDREGDDPGNCGSIRALLHDMWQQREFARRTPQQNSRAVDWRSVLAKTKILLV
ncbi:hypothetical protein C0991_011102 [Blastosporella zonata]|nr:hypothetical protein C0991_011102 [Blastosporella zonata]